MYIRLRNEGKKNTFTIKTQLNSLFVKEHEIKISDINKMNDMLILLNCTTCFTSSRIFFRKCTTCFTSSRIYEKVREIYKVGKIEIVFDTLPGLPTYIEIEAPSKKELYIFCNKLNIDIKNHNTRKLYTELYGLKSLNNMIFKSFYKDYINDIQKNKDMFKNILINQINKFKKII